MSIVRTDISHIEGTNCFCCDENFGIIRKILSATPLEAIHILGTGDYHYLTFFELERIAEPFALVLFDHHNDAQEGAFGNELLSCGNWVLRARRELPELKSSIWIGGDRDYDTPPQDLPLYISVDLDILDKKYAETDWDQGNWSLLTLSESIRAISRGHRIIGGDVCGGLSDSKGANSEDRNLNAKATDYISKILDGILEV